MYDKTFNKKPSKQIKDKSENQGIIKISDLCNKYGYNKEDWEGYELESKITLNTKFCNNSTLSLVEEVDYPDEYVLDQRKNSLTAEHSCYAFADDINNCAFTKVKRGNNKITIKTKGQIEYVCIDDIIILKRKEDHSQNLLDIQIGEYIAQFAKDNAPKSIEYIGTFKKESKENFLFNNNSGRIFGIVTSLCKTNSKKLHQVEVEYYGQINGFSSQKTPFYEISQLTYHLLKYLKKYYHATNSTETKYSWLVKNVR